MALREFFHIDNMLSLSVQPRSARRGPSRKPKQKGAGMVPHIKNYDYELTPQSSALGGGWLLRLLADGRELGRRVFPPVSSIKDKRLAAAAAHDDALARVTTWLASIEQRPPSMRPRPADESGMYLLMPDDELLRPEIPKDREQPVIVEWPRDKA